MGTTDDSGVFSGGSGVEDPNAVHAKPEDIFPGLTDQLAKVPTNTLTPETIPSFFKVGAQTDNATALTGSITRLTPTPEQLAALTDLMMYLEKFMAA